MEEDKIISINTIGIKMAFIALSFFVAIIVFACAIYSSQTPYNAAIDAACVFILFLLPLWIYGELNFYHRRYVFSDRCLRIYKRERLLEEIEWHKILRVYPRLTIVTSDGRRINCTMMSYQQAEAHSIIHTKIAHDLKTA